MVRTETKKSGEDLTDVFNYSYLVLSILLLLTIGATLAYYQNAAAFDDGSGSRWTPVVFLIGICVSLVIFGMTHREAAARHRLHRKTLDLLEAEKQNRALLEEEQRLRISAEQANNAKDEFLAIVSHELKTPLNAIGGWSRILRASDVSDETRQTAIDKIDKNLRIQTNIVEELLSFSDVMSSGLVGINKRILMSDIFEDAVSAVNDSASNKGVTIAIDNALDGERVLGDASRLKTALVNILSNAVKFTPKGGRIEARAFASDGFVNCVISDTGQGIEPAFLPHVFEQYRQSERASTRHYGGLGLGLAIADRIAKLHRGSIHAESSGLGCGAKFTLSLPTTDASRIDSLQE